MTSVPSWKVTPATTFGNWFSPFRRRQVFEAAMKLLYLAIQNAGIHWRRPIEWTAAMGQFAILFRDRFVLSAS